jgi:RNA polymerase sigma-70 factor, ECF subfamily
MAASRIYQEFESRLRRYAIRLARDADSADDLVQETLIRATANLQLLETMNGHRREAWLYRVLKNLFIDERRSSQRRQDMIERLTREAEIAPYTIDQLSSEDLLEAVPEGDRELLEQRYVLGMTSREIGEEIGIPAATVRSRLRQAVRRLRAQKWRFI